MWVVLALGCAQPAPQPIIIQQPRQQADKSPRVIGAEICKDAVSVTASTLRDGRRVAVNCLVAIQDPPSVPLDLAELLPVGDSCNRSRAILAKAKRWDSLTVQLALFTERFCPEEKGEADGDE